MQKFSRLFVLYYILFLFSLIVIEKFLLRKVLIYFRKKGKNLRTILIIGAGKVGIKFFNSIKENPHFGYKVIGFLDDFGIQMLDGLYLGPIKKLNHLLKTKDIDDVIVALPNYATERIHEVIKTCELHGKIVRIIPDYFRFASDKYRISMFAQFPVVTLKDDKVDQIGWRLIKRLFDIAFSSLVIVFIFSWLYPLIALLIKIDSKGPVLYKQERWGRGNKKFYVYKFRSMCCNAAVTDADGKYLQATQNDSRVTRIGKILRKTNIDELPQFINVFIGKMSVVGPRPHPTPLNLISTENIDQYLMRHLVKPGITGWAQVNGLRGETKDKKLMQKRVQYDIWYIENWSFLLDIQIIILTVWHMIKGDPNAY
ncbi:MAG: undecaprenyl-phosphate glucose phosphotransferase [Melioribacter sp.]|nr:undecaprenyl-phosphate glucose phosphotransferase [Melioribacter sp.]